MRNLLIASALVLGSLMTQAQTTVSVTTVTINVNHGYYTPPTYTPNYTVRSSQTPLQVELEAKNRIRRAELARQAEAIWNEKIMSGEVDPNNAIRTLTTFTLRYINEHTPKSNLFNY